MPALSPNPADGLQLLKTTVVPTADPVPVLAQQILKMIVVGNYPNVAVKADNAAILPPGVDRQVIWFTQGLPANYQRQFKPAANVIAFSLSVDNVIKATVTDPNADYTDMEAAFDKAGL